MKVRMITLGYRQFLSLGDLNIPVDTLRSIEFTTTSKSNPAVIVTTVSTKYTFTGPDATALQTFVNGLS